LPGLIHVTTGTVREFETCQGTDLGTMENIHHPYYGEDFSKLVNITKITLHIPWDVSPGFWSSSVARTMVSGGFVLSPFVPGMEFFFKDNIAYFNTFEEAVEKIKYYLDHGWERILLAEKGRRYAEQYLRPVPRVKELIIYLKNYESISY
jgi:hypothetical protein